MGDSLVKIIKENKETFKELESKWGINLDDEIKNIHGLRDFDKFLTIKTHNYKSPDDYYRNSSLGLQLKNIKTPTLIFSATDDPIIRYNLI